MKSLTKDEKYLVALYEASLSNGEGDPFREKEMYALGVAMGLNDRTVSNIVKLLAQTNFVKKKEGTFIALTPHGLKLIQSLI